MTTFEARIELLPGTVAPDVYDPSQGRIPLDDFVVSRFRDGSPASYYGDLSWNRTPYDPDGRTRFLHFTYWDHGDLTPQRDELTREIRWMMFLLIYLRRSDALSNSSLEGYLVALRRLARLCEAGGVRLQDALADPALMTGCAENAAHLSSIMATVVTFLRSLGREQVGFEAAGKSADAALKAIYRKWCDNSKQYAPIPTRIYSMILSVLSDEIEAFEDAADRLLRVYQDCRHDPLLGREASRQQVIRKRMNLTEGAVRPRLASLLPEYGLDEFFAARGTAPTLHGLSSLFREALLIASLQIQAFTGMRHNEVMALPFNCLETIERDGRPHHIIKGRITKLTKGKVKRTQWVTSEAGRRAVLLAQRFAEAVYLASGVTPSRDASQPSPGFLFISSQLVASRPELVATNLHLNEFVDLRARLQPAITDADLCELEQIDPHRAWRSEEAFQAGRPWTLTSHQLRRSLALYAQRSGLVSLPSLKRQLQHITYEMSTYYARGSAFAKNFIGDDKRHFGLEWQETQPVSQYLSYAAHVLMTDDVLFGAHPNWIDHRLRDADGIVLQDREITLKRFQKGQMAYRETPIGGCVNVGDCELTPGSVLEVECLSNHCRNIVGSLSKLERVIAAQTRRVNKLRLLDPQSPECRNEESDLAIFVATRDNVLKDNARRCADGQGNSH